MSVIFQVLARAGPIQKYSNVQSWNPLDVPIIREFIGIILNIRLVKKHGIYSDWNVRNYSEDTPMYSRVFTKTTFKNIMRIYHA